MKRLKLIKIIVKSLLVASVLTLNPIGASAEWKQDSNGWWNTEGSSWTVGWRLIDEKWYYFGQDGYMAHDTIVDGYKLGSDGAWIQTNQNNSTQNSYVELEKLPKEYNVDDAEKDGDVVQILGDIKYNIEKLDKFMKNYKDKKATVGDIVRILMSGDDTGPTIRDLIINSDGSIKLKNDNTRDWMSSEEYRVIKEYKVVDIYTRDNTSGYRTYYIKTDQGEEMFIGNSDIH
jgi:FOG: Glucan-binding domain (YG repeat)